MNQHSWTVITEAGYTAKNVDTSQSRLLGIKQVQNQQAEVLLDKRNVKTVQKYFIILFAMKSVHM